MAVLVYGNLAINHSSNVWRTDGLTQHFPAFYHFNQLVRRFLHHPGRGFELWSWNLGMGGDNLGALSYYMSDPFAFLSLVFPMRALEYAYEWIFFARVFAAGLAAYAYLLGMRYARYPSILGSLIYTFTMFSMLTALRHPYFADAMVFFPLILLGIEHSLARRRPYVLIAAVFLSAVSNFYFFYQMTIIAIIYGVVRYFEITPSRLRFRRFAISTLIVGGIFALGTVLAAFMLEPALAEFFASSRAGTSQPVPFLYELTAYRNFISALTSNSAADHEMYAGYSILGLLVLPALYMRRKNLTLKFMLALFPLLLVFPYFGKVFNGFAFPSYRFLFMWPLFLGAAVASLLSANRAFSRRELAWMFFGLVGYSLLVVAAAPTPGASFILPLFLGVLMWALFAFETLGIYLHRRDASESAEQPGTGGAPPERPQRNYSLTLRLGVALLVVAGIGYVAWCAYDPSTGHALDNFVAYGNVLASFEQDQGAHARSSSGDGFFRVEKQDDVYGSSRWVTASNDALVQDFNGTAYYYSVMNGSLFQYLRSVDDRSMRAAYDFTGFDDRASLETLNGVRYYIASNIATQYVPFGFDEVSHDQSSTVYQNRYALPLGYVYHSAIASSTYALMSPLDRQQTMLQCVVVDDGVAPDVPRISPDTGIRSVPHSVGPMANTIWDPGVTRIGTTASGGGVLVSFPRVPGAELYIDLTGLKYRLNGPDADTREKNPATVPDDPGSSPATAYLSTDVPMHLAFGTTGPSKIERDEAPGYPYFWDDNSALVNLGYFPKGTDLAHIRVVETATVEASDIQVYAIPMDTFAEQVGRLAAEGMHDVRIGVNRVSGNVTSHGSGVLFLSIPYNTGWSAKVDGSPAQIVKANVGFLGIPVTGGEHHVELSYFTPGLIPGLALSGLALAGVISLVTGWELYHVRRRRRIAEGLVSPADGH